MLHHLFWKVVKTLFCLSLLPKKLIFWSNKWFYLFCHSQVKALYVKNIPENTSTEKLKELFQRHGEVTKVVMPPGKASGKRDFGFIHYAERSSALKAVKDTEKYEIDGIFPTNPLMLFRELQRCANNLVHYVLNLLIFGLAHTGNFV